MIDTPPIKMVELDASGRKKPCKHRNAPIFGKSTFNHDTHSNKQHHERRRRSSSTRSTSQRRRPLPASRLPSPVPAKRLPDLAPETKPQPKSEPKSEPETASSKRCKLSEVASISPEAIAVILRQETWIAQHDTPPIAIKARRDPDRREAEYLTHKRHSVVLPSPLRKFDITDPEEVPSIEILRLLSARKEFDNLTTSSRVVKTTSSKAAKVQQLREQTVRREGWRVWIQRSFCEDKMAVELEDLGFTLDKLKDDPTTIGYRVLRGMDVKPYVPKGVQATTGQLVRREMPKEGEWMPM